jgi:hypothetical protein
LPRRSVACATDDDACRFRAVRGAVRAHRTTGSGHRHHGRARRMNAWGGSSCLRPGLSSTGIWCDALGA